MRQLLPLPTGHTQVARSDSIERLVRHFLRKLSSYSHRPATVSVVQDWPWIHRPGGRSL